MCRKMGRAVEKRDLSAKAAGLEIVVVRTGFVGIVWRTARRVGEFVFVFFVLNLQGTRARVET